jgi:hypothetical protein
MEIMDGSTVPTDGIITGNEPANEPTIMSEMGILMDLEQVISRSTTSAASTVEASSVKANMVEPNVPMAADGTTNEVDADAMSTKTRQPSRSSSAHRTASRVMSRTL